MPDRSIRFDVAEYFPAKILLSDLKKQFPDVVARNTVDRKLDVEEFLLDVFDVIKHEWPQHKALLRDCEIGNQSSVSIEAY